MSSNIMGFNFNNYNNFKVNNTKHEPQKEDVEVQAANKVEESIKQKLHQNAESYSPDFSYWADWNGVTAEELKILLDMQNKTYYKPLIN